MQPEQIAQASAGVEIVSQEEGTLLLAFATEQQLEDFEAKLARLAVGQRVTYQNVLYALQDLDHWSPEDRAGWALRRDGFPDTEFFPIDVELWPLARSNDMARMRRAFETWVDERGGEVLDAVRQPYLTIYRMRCSSAVADDLLRYRDVRTVDLPPRIGLEPILVRADVQQLDEVPDPPPDAPGLVVLDTGIAAGHPVLAPAVGDAQSFLENHGCLVVDLSYGDHNKPYLGRHVSGLEVTLDALSRELAGAPAADDHGHGTFVSGIALYNDVAECLRNRRFVPELRLFSGRILDHQNQGNPTLIENQVERAVRYFVENYGCRVFNLSYGDHNKPYLGRHVAGLAVTLDALSRELDVLFVVPTGNYEGDDDGPGDWHTEYPGYLLGDSATLLDPAPALNALTVGSLARHERNARWPNDPAYRPIARTDQPSPFTRRGPSVNRAVKPDLVDYGGNMIVNVRAQAVVRQRGARALESFRPRTTSRPDGHFRRTRERASRRRGWPTRRRIFSPNFRTRVSTSAVRCWWRTPGRRVRAWTCSPATTR